MIFLIWSKAAPIRATYASLMQPHPTHTQRPFAERALLLLLGVWIVLAQAVALRQSMPTVAAQTALCSAHGGLAPLGLSAATGVPATNASHACCFDCVLGAPTPPLAWAGTLPLPPGFVAPLAGLAVTALAVVAYALPPARAPPIRR